MKNITINLVNAIGDTCCIEAKDGEKIFELIKKALSEDKKVTISFRNVEIVTIAFLTSAFGQLYREFEEGIVKDNIKVDNISESGKVLLKRIVENAKLYYKDPDAMQRSINEMVNN